MFDWARGSLLKRLIESKLVVPSWDPYVKDWHEAWLKGLIDFHPAMSVLDIGAGNPHFMRHLNQKYGCDVHALDVDNSAADNPHFGFRAGLEKSHPQVKLHFGLAGDESLPAEQFDMVTCISALEHTYDHDSPVNPARPVPHLNALRDMVRMLKPGGVFLMNWDFFYNGRTHNIGYDFEMDYQILRHCGLGLLSGRRRVRGLRYIYDHPETLFFDAEAALKASTSPLRRGSPINVLWRKPGDGANVPFRPRPELEPYYFPEDETTSRDAAAIDNRLTTDDIERRFHAVIERLTEVLARNKDAGAVRLTGRRRVVPGVESIVGGDFIGGFQAFLKPVFRLDLHLAVAFRQKGNGAAATFYESPRINRRLKRK